MKQKRQFRLSIFGAIMISALMTSGCENSPNPPDADTVAIFKDGRITRQEVKDAVDKLYTGFGKNEETAKQLHRKEVYREIVKGMVLDRVVKLKITTMKLDKRDNIKHVMKHISEELNISELHSKAHEGQIKVSEEEIKSRYEQNRTLFGQATLVQVNDQIRAQLEREKEEIYFQDYMNNLRKNAVITRYYELLKVPDLIEADLRMHYEQKRNSYPGKSFEDARDAVVKTLFAKNTERWFQENRNRTLMTIHGKRFTVGEFMDEIQELPPSERERYGDFKSMKALLDKMTDRMLLVEDTYDQMLSTETRNERGHIREDILRQVLHQEEVDDQIQVLEEEMQAFFKENPSAFVQPPRVQINYIRIGTGQTDATREQAQKKVKEAYKKIKPGLFKKGEPFEKIAGEYSEDPETAKKGGALDGWISENTEMIAEIANHGFHENVLGLGEQDISRPFLFHGSYYIVQVRERQEPSPMTFEQVREKIEGELKARKHDELTLLLEKNLLDQAKPVIFDKVIESMLEENV